MDDLQQDSTLTADLSAIRANIINSLEQAAGLNQESKRAVVRDAQILLDIFRFEMEGPAITVEEIIERVAIVRGTTVDKILTKSRSQRLAYIRGEAMYLSRRLTDRSFPQIGESFNHDHTTVMSACAVIAERVANKPAYRATMEELERRVKG